MKIKKEGDEMENKGNGYRTWEVFRHDNGAPKFIGQVEAKSKSHAVRLVVVANQNELLEPYSAGQIFAKPAED